MMHIIYSRAALAGDVARRLVLAKATIVSKCVIRYAIAAAQEGPGLLG